ncbi:MAG: hypothetical protein Q9211_000544 [Gyalolechia sp. 1 TL-2023]
MALNGATPKTEKFDLSDDDTEALFASPSRPQRTKPSKSIVPEPPRQQSCELGDHGVDNIEARQTVLRKELAGIRNINQVIESAIGSLERVGVNMNTVSCTVNDASALLNTWTRILSQTEHNQRLILDPSWRGATQDMADIESESIAKQQQKERRELEEAQKREARARKAEEDERRKAENLVMKTPRAGRGRVRPTSRGGGSGRPSSFRASVAVAKDSGLRAGRAGSGIGRGPNGHRGRSRET